MTFHQSNDHTKHIPMTPRKKAPLTSATALALTSVLTASAGAFGVPAALNVLGPETVQAKANADALPVSPTSPQGAQRWNNPNLRTGDQAPAIGIDLREVPATVRLGETLTVSLRITNNSSETINTGSSNLSILPKRAEAQTSVESARSALAQNPEAFQYFGRLISVQEALGDDVDIAPGESIDLSLDIPTSADAGNGIDISQPGFYPFLLGVHTANGTEATQRYLLSVLGSNDDESSASKTQTYPARDYLSPRAAQVAAAASEGADNATSDRAQQPAPAGETTNAAEPEKAQTPQAAVREAATPLSVVVPITADVNIVPGETGDAPERQQLILTDESLATQLRPGGRIATMVANLDELLSGNEQLARATCLAIDPQLVDALDRMADGYIVAAERPSPVSQKQRLRDSWADNTDSFISEPGAGSADARTVLEKLRSLTDTQCSVALPWANANLNAVADASNSALMREALVRGQETLARVLDTTPVTNVVISPNGYITESTAPLVGWADVSDYLGNPSQNSETSGAFAEEDVAADQWERSKNRASKASSADETPEAENTEVASELDEQNSLESLSSNESAESAAAPKPQKPVRVLVADNTLWNTPKRDRFAVLGQKVTAVGYDAGLSQVLAEASESPQTVAYGSYDVRFNGNLDSLNARLATAQSALRMAVDEANGLDGQQPRPVLAMLPAISDDGGAVSVLNTAASLLETGQAKALPLGDFVTPAPDQARELTQLAQSQQATTGGQQERFGAPYDDPTEIADTEVLGIRQQAAYVDDLTSLMVDDPKLALTPYTFTAPLRQDLLRALSYNGRNEANKFDDRVANTEHIASNNREALMQLRDSVSLLPPGNVYTRISDASPLLIVARNGLPLPVNAHLQYTGPDNSKLSTPSPLVIPAKGSMTVSMTADLPEEPNRTNLSLWLATSQDAGISAPVDITVQTQKGLSGRSGLAIGLVIALALILLGRVFILRKRKKNTRVQREQRQQGAASPRTSVSARAPESNGGTQSSHDVARRRNQPRRGGDKSTGDFREPS